MVRPDIGGVEEQGEEEEEVVIVVWWAILMVLTKLGMYFLLISSEIQ